MVSLVCDSGEVCVFFFKMYDPCLLSHTHSHSERDSEEEKTVVVY